jgi:hypothetical protein
MQDLVVNIAIDKAQLRSKRDHHQDYLCAMVSSHVLGKYIGSSQILSMEK